MRRFLIISLLALVSLSIKAQTLTNAERRLINSRILTVIEEYERFSSLYDDEAEYYFETLFANDSSVTVFCDMLGMPPYLKDIPVSEYIKLMREQSLNTSITIKNVVKGEMEFDQGVWNVPVRFRKSISYIDQGGYVFSVEDYYNTDFNIVMYMSYDPDTDRCLVRSIKGNIVSEKEFPAGRFAIIEKDDNLDSRTARYMSTLTLDNRPLQYNQFGQAMLPNGEAKVEDPDVEVYVDTKYKGYNYDVLSFKFTPRNTRVRFRYGLAPFAYSVKSPNTNIKAKSFANEIGADFGYAMTVNESSKLTFNIGAGLSWSSLRLAYNPVEAQKFGYKYAVPGESGLFESKEILYTVEGAAESVKYVDVFVPVYLEMEHVLNKFMVFSWNLGVKAYLALSAKVDEAYTLDATYQIDSKEHPVKLHSEPVSGNPFFIDAETYAKNPIDLSAMANLGLDVDVYKRRLYAQIRVGYELGLMQSYKSANRRGYRNTNQIVFDPYEENHIALNSLISGLSFKRNSLWISLGVKFKM